MTESHLLKLVERLYTDCNNYCVICLRTDTERRLGLPKYLKIFIQSLDKTFIFDRPFQMVCYVCERQAAAAHRFWQALQVAARAHTLVHDLVQKPEKLEKLAGAVQNYNTQGDKAAPNHPIWLKGMLDCEIKIRRQRMRSQFLNTEVLIISTNAPATVSTNAPATVSTNAPATPSDPEEKKTVREKTNKHQNYVSQPAYTHPIPTGQCSVPGESRDLFVIPDALPPVLNTAVADTCDLDIKPETLGSIIVIHNDDGNKRKDKALMIDSGNIQYINNAKHVIKRNVVPESTVQENQLYVTTRVETWDKTYKKSVNYLLHPIIIQGDTITVPSLSAQIKDGRLISEQNGKIQMETPQIAFQAHGNINFITDASKVVSMFKKIAGNEGSFKRARETMLSREESSENVAKEPQLRSDRIDREEKRVRETRLSGVKSSEKVAKEPQLRSDRIDWEEKIPMDVISFIDDKFGRDVCKRARKMPAIGISNVTSLEPESNVINLC